MIDGDLSATCSSASTRTYAYVDIQHSVSTRLLWYASASRSVHLSHKHDEDEVKLSEEMVDHYEDAGTAGGWFLGICLFAAVNPSVATRVTTVSILLQAIPQMSVTDL